MFEKLRPALSRSLRGMCTRLFRFGKNSEGAYAMEFALVAAPFFAIIFGIIETSMVFFKEETLQTAVSDSARLILTGQAQANGMSASDFKAEVCNRVAALIDCSNVSIDVEAFADFSGTPINPVDRTSQLRSDEIAIQSRRRRVDRRRHRLRHAQHVHAALQQLLRKAQQRSASSESLRRFPQRTPMRPSRDARFDPFSHDFAKRVEGAATNPTQTVGEVAADAEGHRRRRRC